MSATTAATILENPYIRALSDGSMGLHGFRSTQEQFSFAVAFYPRPLAALASRLSAPEDRVGLVRNLVEEHGGFDRRGFHQATFSRFLALIGGRPPEVAEPPVLAFNAALWGVCTESAPALALGCLGAIESEFADASEAIGKAAVARGWVEGTRLVHYSLHAAVDKRHAQELWEPLGRRGAEGRELGRQGMRLGEFLLGRLYRDLRGP